MSVPRPWRTTKCLGLGHSSRPAQTRSDNPCPFQPTTSASRAVAVRRATRFAVTACVVAFTAISYTTPAHAGSYVIGDCPAAADQAPTAGPWELVGELDSPSFAVKQNCSGGPEDWLGIANVVFWPILTGFGVDTTGTPIKITHLRVWWRAFGSTSESSVAEIAVRNTAGYPLPGFSTSTTNTLWDTTGGPQELSFSPSEEASSVEIGERCATECNTQSTALYEGIPLLVQFFGAELTLNDPTPPTLTLTNGPNNGESPALGMIPLSFFASDPGAGIKTAELLVDGTPVASRDYSSSCSYTQLRPCPESETGELSVDGESLPEGTHQLSIKVTDAAGNAAVSASRGIITTRPPTPNGRPCPQPSLTSAIGQKIGTVTLQFDKQATVEGRLGCGETPIPGASVVLETSFSSGVRHPSLTTITTGNDGTFRYQLPVGPNRTLSFRYYAYSSATSPSAQTTLQIRVVPRLTLHIHPRHTHNNDPITWSGRVEGGPYPTRGMPVLVQVKEERRWQTFDEIISYGGKIKYSYTFRRTLRPTTYAFRISLPAGGDVGYAYDPGASRTIKVHVQ
jgi:hypothetical protein